MHQVSSWGRVAHTRPLPAVRRGHPSMSRGDHQWRDPSPGDRPPPVLPAVHGWGETRPGGRAGRVCVVPAAVHAGCYCERNCGGSGRRRHAGRHGCDGNCDVLTGTGGGLRYMVKENTGIPNIVTRNMIFICINLFVLHIVVN